MKNINILDYIKEAESIEKLYLEIITLCTFTRHGGVITYYSAIITKEAKPLHREILKRYEVWYAVTKRIVRQYSDKHIDFNKEYDDVKKLISLKYRHSGSGYTDRFIYTFDKQVNILHTIIPILSLKSTNFKKLITADLLDSELSQAELLYKKDYYRAAGAITGVVLERYLKTLCEINQVEIGGNDTIEPLATKLYKSDKLPDFDITLFKSIQHLASIRNKCTHPKEEPEQHQVREFIDRVKKITLLEI